MKKMVRETDESAGTLKLPSLFQGHSVKRPGFVAIAIELVRCSCCF
jgi:hypothetical protein